MMELLGQMGIWIAIQTNDITVMSERRLIRSF